MGVRTARHSCSELGAPAMWGVYCAPGRIYFSEHRFGLSREYGFQGASLAAADVFYGRNSLVVISSPIERMWFEISQCHIGLRLYKKPRELVGMAVSRGRLRREGHILLVSVKGRFSLITLSLETFLLGDT